MQARHFHALLDGAGDIQMFPDTTRPAGSFDLRAWRLGGMLGMFVLLTGGLATTTGLALGGVHAGLAMLPWLSCLALFVYIQVRCARIPRA